MKKVFLLMSAVAVFASCAVSNPKLVTTASSEDLSQFLFVRPVCAELEVSPTKISYVLNVTESIYAGGGLENAINTAIKEALEKNGNADVLVALQTQTKYSSDDKIESVSISGYPAKYVNFQTVKDSTGFRCPMCPGKISKGKHNPQPQSLMPVLKKKKK